MKKRYSAVVLLSEDLNKVVLVHKQKPDWQKDKANFPGGKVEGCDECNTPEYVNGCMGKFPLYKDGLIGYWIISHQKCAIREVREETGLLIDNPTLFCVLKFQEAECHFFYYVGDITKASTMEEAVIFIDTVNDVLNNRTMRFSPEHGTLPTMPNLSWLIAMALSHIKNGKLDGGSYLTVKVDN